MSVIEVYILSSIELYAMLVFEGGGNPLSLINVMTEVRQKIRESSTALCA